jgi:Arc/MetJ-type ribon-helix-helix transcriptional regulator
MGHAPAGPKFNHEASVASSTEIADAGLGETLREDPLQSQRTYSIYHLAGWERDGKGMGRMASTAQQLRTPDSEKITINLGYVDLGHIDLLVQDGFYSNRTDFIRTAIRNQFNRHTDAVKQSVTRQQLDLGLRQYNRQDLEAVKAAGERLQIQVLGLALIAADVSPELAAETIASIHVLGAFQASPAVKAALHDRIR